MHGIRYHYIRFYRFGKWLSCYRDKEIGFWESTDRYRLTCLHWPSVAEPQGSKMQTQCVLRASFQLRMAF